MKKFNTLSLLLCLAVIAILPACMKMKVKDTEIPISTKSEEAKASVMKGLELGDQGDMQKARTAYSKAIEQDPKLAIAYILRAGSSQSSKEFADDINTAKANMEGISEWEKMYCDLYTTFLNSDWNKRLELTQKIAADYPDAARAQVDLGFTYEAGNQFDKARACFQKAVEKNQKWVGGYSALVNSYLFEEPKDFKKAEENALKVVELAPTSPGAAIALGDCYRAQNSLEKARDAYAKAIGLDPNDAAAYYKSGHANSFLGNYDEARRNYMEGAKHDETKSSSILSITNSYLYAGDMKTAMSYLAEQTAKLDASGETPGRIVSEKMNCLNNSASIAIHMGDAAKLKELIAAMEPISVQMGNDVGTEEAKLGQKANILFYKAMLAAIEGNLDAAKKNAKEIKTTLASIKDPNKLDAYEFVSGFIAMKEKKYADAVTHFGKTVQSSIYNKYWNAMANKAAGNKEKASALFKEISTYNFNEIGYALVRAEVMKKATTL